MTSNRILRLRVNGSTHLLGVPPNALLLDVLREELGLTGTKRGCDMGTCGCCNVVIDGRAVMSCLVLAHDCAGKDVLTVEGLTGESGLHPLQEAWAECGGSQCGFCTPGFIMTSHALLAREPNPSERRIREAIAGNVCRCTGFQKIVQAIGLAAQRLAASHAGATHA
jgi:carbon-monoxide dehydrogenase small subunit